MVIKPGSTIGIVGGGQLGRMAALAAAHLGYNVHIFTDEKHSPASYVASKTTVARYTNKQALERFAHAVDVVTFEFENIPSSTVAFLAKHVAVRPNPDCLYIAQHRLREKEFLNQIHVKTAPYREVSSVRTLQQAFKAIGAPCLLKTVELGYDGKGQHIIDENTNLTKLWKSMKVKTAIVEQMIPFEKEISVIVARGSDGGAIAYIPSENLHAKGILDLTLAPARITNELIEESWDIAHRIADALELVGILAVEFFVTKEGTLLVNELAPRPHNSGHWTLDGCVTSQFEQMVRAVCGLPLGSTHHHSSVVMKNLIGEDVLLWEEFIGDPDTKIYLYGKKEVRPGRKMGHVNHILSEEDILVDPKEG